MASHRTALGGGCWYRAGKSTSGTSTSGSRTSGLPALAQQLPVPRRGASAQEPARRGAQAMEEGGEAREG
eukprot:910316-Rhodomonas_salina.2